MKTRETVSLCIFGPKDTSFPETKSYSYTTIDNGSVSTTACYVPLNPYQPFPPNNWLDPWRPIINPWDNTKPNIYPRQPEIKSIPDKKSLDPIPHKDSKYPPLKITKVTDGEYKLEFAVASFYKEDLSVEIIRDNELFDILHVSGKKQNKDDQSAGEVIYNTLASRNFDVYIDLAKYEKQIKSKLEEGILTIDLKVIVPKEKQNNKIDIE